MLIPEENAKDLVEIADSIKSGLEIVPVSRMDEVLAHAMTRKAGADRVGRDHDHRSGRARGGPARGGSLDAHRALNDREPERHARLEPRPLAAAAVVRQNLDYGRTIVIAASMPK